jgi:hypothetical protein
MEIDTNYTQNIINNNKLSLKNLYINMQHLIT